MANWVNLMDVVYPIGSYYLSYDKTSPAQIFGGSWFQTYGYNLFPANPNTTDGGDVDSYYVGSSSGSETDVRMQWVRMFAWRRTG